MPNFQNHIAHNEYYHNQNVNTIQENSDTTIQAPNTKSETDNSENTENRSIKNVDEPFIEVFGIKLYFDDVLILSLLFFLYSENIKDEGLFLSLVLLLIT